MTMRRNREADFVLPVDLTATELALLEFTNGSATSTADRRRLLLTSKEAYLWAALVAVCAKSPNVTGEKFEIATRGMLEEFNSVRSPGEFDPAHSEALYVLLISSFARRVGLDAELTEIYNSVRQSYAGLLKRGLVEDPFFLVPNLLHAVGSTPHLASMGIAVLGLIPTEFGRVTKAGKTTSLKIRSLYLDYERTAKGNQTSIQVHFRVLQFAKCFLDLARSGLDALDRNNVSTSTTKIPKGKKAQRGRSKRTK